MGCGASTTAPRPSDCSASTSAKVEESPPQKRAIIDTPAAPKPNASPAFWSTGRCSNRDEVRQYRGKIQYGSKRAALDDSDIGRVTHSKQEMSRTVHAKSSKHVTLNSDSAAGGSPSAYKLRRAQSETIDHSFRFVNKYVSASNEAQGRKHHQAVRGEMESEMRKRLQDVAKSKPIEDKDAAFLIRRLQNHFLFKEFSEASLKMLCERMEKRTIKPGETLAKQGDEASEMYVVMEGFFDVYVQKEGSDTPLKVAHCGIGSVLGEMALMYNTNRTATMVASYHGGDSIVFSLPRAVYQLTLIGKMEKTDTPRKLRQVKEGEGETSNPKSATLDLAGWLSEAMMIEDLEELADRMRHASVRTVFSQPAAPMLLFVKSGGVTFTPEAGKEDPRARNNSLELLEEGHLTAGDALLISNHGEEKVLVAMFESYIAKAKRSGREVLPKLRIVGHSFHKAAVTADGRDTELLFVPLSELFPLLSYPDELLAQLACIRGLVMMCPWFSDLPPLEFDSLIFGFKARRVSEQTMLIAEDYELTSLFLIVQGRFQITQVSKTRGCEYIICNAEAGDLLGEYSCATGKPSEVSAQAMTETLLLQLDREAFKASPFAIAKASACFHNRAISKPRFNGDRTQLSELSCIAVIGRGAFARVALVKSKKKTFVLKKMDRNYLRQKQVYKQVLNERSVMGCLDHPNICKLYTTFKTHKSIMMILEPCMGGELYSYMRKKDILEPDACRFYVACVISALEHLHKRHIVYRDLKPENIVLTETGFAKIVDFGFARRLTSRAYTLCGTPEYLAPEQIQMSGHDHAADWWAVGVLLYEMAMGAVPFCFAGPKPDFDMNPTQLYANILDSRFSFYLPLSLDPLIVDLVMKLLMHNPMHRLGRLTGGAQDVKRHPLFVSCAFDWEALCGERLAPPYKPQITSTEDLRNFDTVKSDPDFLNEQPYNYSPSEWDYHF